MAPEVSRPRRVLLLFPGQSYRVDAYVAAAKRLGVELVLGTDLPRAFRTIGFETLAVDFSDADSAAVELARLAERGLDGIVATSEGSAVVAALLAERLGLPHASAAGALAARNKRRMRERFAETGVPSPRFAVLAPHQDPASLAGKVSFPCVVKPPMLSGSQGVIRADSPGELTVAVRRIRAILAGHGSHAASDPEFHALLVEDYLPGREVAVEALVTRGQLDVLAIFDKPDELAGPFFEETLYVTPSRLSASALAEILRVTELGARALGLSHGPIHAELRFDGARASVVEIAARSIGGLCSRTLQAAVGSLEELIVAHAAGLPAVAPQARLSAAAGVMMIPIPRSGVLRRVRGLDQSRAVPGIVSVTLALEPGESIRALPEGASYLGFIFARGDSPDEVERALRASHAALEIELSPLLDVLS